MEAAGPESPCGAERARTHPTPSSLHGKLQGSSERPASASPAAGTAGTGRTQPTLPHGQSRPQGRAAYQKAEPCRGLSSWRGATARHAGDGWPPLPQQRTLGWEGPLRGAGAMGSAAVKQKDTEPPVCLVVSVQWGTWNPRVPGHLGALGTPLNNPAPSPEWDRCKRPGQTLGRCSDVCA